MNVVAVKYDGSGSVVVKGVIEIKFALNHYHVKAVSDYSFDANEYFVQIV